MLRSGSERQGELLHLVRDDAEASLCGLPRSSLGPSDYSAEVVCQACIDWLGTGSAMLRRVGGDSET
jgi:hypothetical protein